MSAPKVKKEIAYQKNEETQKQIKKKLEKGKSIKQIAVELEESREAVQKIVNELK